LHESGVPYEWDENGDLAVLEADEARVEAMLDAIEFPESLPVADQGEDLDGDGIGDTAGDDTDVQDTLSDLFVAADRLMRPRTRRRHRPRRTARGRHARPYGFSPPVWADITARAASLRTMLDSSTEADSDDDVIIDHARALRTVLRRYV
jgi:hypothetical protein